MKAIKCMLLGLGFIFTALFCIIAAREYAVGLVFGLIFLIGGLALMVLGFLGDWSEIKELGKAKSQQSGDTKVEENKAENSENGEITE